VLSNVFLIGIADWFPYIGANQHVTPDLTNLIGSESYLGNGHLYIGDGK